MQDWYTQLKTQLKPVMAVEIKDEHSIVSSVIIPVGFNKESNQNEILMTKRTDLVHTHKNEVGFPGGVYDPNDSGNVLRTAVREIYEEIGVLEKDLEILGMLSPVRTIGDVLIFPFVAKMDFPYPYVLNADEVARVLYVPLNKLINEGLNPIHVQVGSHKVKSIGTTVENELIWGASAKMLEELRDILRRT